MNGVECTLSKSDNTKVGGVAGTPGGHDAAWHKLYRLEKQAHTNLRKFSKEECKVLYLGKNKYIRICQGAAS